MASELIDPADRRPASGITLREEPADSPAAMALLAGFNEEIARLYPSQDPSTMLQTHPTQLEPPAGAFLVAYAGDVPVGCGGLKRFAEGIAEVKRVFVAPHARSRGIARQMVSELERLATERGYRAIRLDTGPRQPHALALYRSSGYREIRDYNGNPLAGHWFEKPLPRTPDVR
jgi:GNAT superfamily N-acetyltransferase